MGVPSELLKQTNPIVEKALETGARGQTTTVTNYGVIGDALHKKAQLDLQIADLKGNFGLKAAEIQSNLKMREAEMSFQKAMYEDQNEASGFEQILGTLSGVATGAAGGFAVGGPTGAIVGGAIGGATTYAGYASGGRQGGQQAQQTIGNISNLAVGIKGFSDQRKKQDAVSSILQTGANLAAEVNNAQGHPEERMAAQQQLDYFIQQSQADMAQYMNPQEVMQFGKSLRGQFDRQFEDDTSVNANGMTKGQAVNDILNNTVEAQSALGDPNVTESKKRAIITNTVSENSRLLGLTTGKPMTEQAMMQEAEAITPGGSKYLNFGGGQQKTQVPAPVRQAPQAPVTEEVEQPSQGVSQRPPANNSVPAPQQQKEEVNYQGAFGDAGIPLRNLANAPGVEMDGGVTSESLLKQGAETAKILQKDEPIVPLKDPDEKKGRFARMKEALFSTPFSPDELEGKEFNKQVEKLTDKEGKAEQEINEVVSKVPAEMAGKAKEVVANIDKQIDKIANGDVETFSSQGANIGRTIRKEGVGGKVGSWVGLDNVGQGSTIGMGEIEAAEWDEMEQLTEVNASTLARLSGEKGAMSEGDIQRFKKLVPSPAKTKLQNVQGLVAQKEMIATKLKSMVTEDSGAVDKVKLQKDQLDIEYKRNRNTIQRQKMGGSGSSGYLIRIK